MKIILYSILVYVFCTMTLYGAAHDKPTLSAPPPFNCQRLTAIPHAVLQLPSSKTIVVAGLLEQPDVREYKYQLTYFSAELESVPRSYRWIHEYPIAQITHNNEERIHILFPLTMRDIRGPTMGPRVDSTKMTAIVKSFVDHTVYTATPSGDVIAVCSHSLFSRERILSLYAYVSGIREIPLHAQLHSEETIQTLALSSDSSLAVWASDRGNLGIVATHTPFSWCKSKIKKHARCTAVAINPHKTRIVCCYNTGEYSRGEQIRAYCAYIALQTAQYACGPSISPLALTLLKSWRMPHVATTCMFLSNHKLLIGTTGKEIYLYCP